MTRTRGLTMLEALLAIAVLGVLLATVASLQVSNLTVTRAAAADGARLEVARAVFETTARRVEDDFEAYRACAGGAGACRETGTRDGFAYDVALHGDPVARRVGGADVATRGLVRIDVTVEGRGGATSLNRHVSCLAATVSPAPSVADPGAVCE